LNFKNVKFLMVRGGVDKIGRQLAVAIKTARAIGLPLAQGQCDVGALQ
jgi:hypothetical protein